VIDHSLIAFRLGTTFSPLAATLFSPQDVWVEKNTQFNYTTTLGHPGNVNATYSFIQALLLAAAQGIYGVSLFSFDLLESDSHRDNHRGRLTCLLSQAKP